MRAGGERPRLELELRVGVGMDPEVAAVDLEVPDEAHAVDDEPGVGDGPVERERAAVEPGAAPAEPGRQHVVASGNGDRPGRDEGGVAGLGDRASLLEAELPGTIQVQRGDGGGRHGGRERDNEGQDAVFHASSIPKKTEMTACGC